MFLEIVEQFFPQNHTFQKKYLPEVVYGNLRQYFCKYFKAGSAKRVRERDVIFNPPSPSQRPCLITEWP